MFRQFRCKELCKPLAKAIRVYLFIFPWISRELRGDKFDVRAHKT